MDTIVEKIAGSEIGGCYVAAYASTPLSGEGGYVGYYKIFPDRVKSYFACAPCIAKGASSGRARSASEAADLALAAARWHLEDLADRAERDVAEDSAWAMLPATT